MARNAELTDTLRAMLEVQQTQNERIAAALEQTANSIPHSRPGSVADFRRLRPTVFTGEESPLAAEQWLVDTENLLTAARIPEEEKVHVVRVQMVGLARSWWLMEEEYLPKPVMWATFTKAFLSKHFPDTAKADMEQKFINLRQGSWTVDEYAAEFTKLSRFAPYMVNTEANRAKRFQQGLHLELQNHLANHEFSTYSGVLA